MMIRWAGCDEDLGLVHLVWHLEISCGGQGRPDPSYYNHERGADGSDKKIV